MEELRLNQIDGNVKKVSANVDSDYKIPEHEKHLIHARIYNPQFNGTTGKDESVKRVQTFYPLEFDQLTATGGFAGAKVEVLHDPSKKSDGETLDFTGAQKPAVVSQPAAGTRLDVKIEDQPESVVRKIYEDLYKQDAQKDLSLTDVYAAIKERINFLNEEKRVENFKQQGEGIEAAKNLSATSTQTAQPAGSGNASQGGAVNNAGTAATGAAIAEQKAGAANTATAGNKPATTAKSTAAGAGDGK